jgi:phage tail-like protein
VANPANETVEPPYTSFRFEVVLELNSALPGVGSPICNAAFAECDGLEMSMEPKAIREGGNNAAQPHRIGPVSYSQLTLRRGMTASLDLWRWFAAAARPGQDASASGRVTLMDASGAPRITFTLLECLPVKVRGPALNAKDGMVAVEELQLVYASMEVGPPDAPSAGQGIGVSAGFTAGISAGISAGASVGGGISVGGGLSAGIDLG